MRACGPLARLAPLASFLGASLLGACQGVEPAPGLTGLSPARAYTDRDLRVVLHGSELLPSYRVDPSNGRREGDTRGFHGWVGEARAPLRDFGWRGLEELSATLPRGLPPGLHQVVLEDPRGRRAVLPDAFESLGPDTEAPRIEIDTPSPDLPLAPGMRVPCRARITDDPGLLERVTWESRGPGGVVAAGACPVDPEAGALACRFEVAVPAYLREGDRFDVLIDATDRAPDPNSTSRRLTFRLLARPTITQVTPSSGGIAGGTEVVVRGSGFLPGTRVFMGALPLYPGGGLRLDATTITGRVPPQPRGPAAVVARTPIGDAQAREPFEYAPAPLVEGIDPAVAPAAGGTQVRVFGEHFTPETRVYLGPTFPSALPLLGQERTTAREMRGLVPAGSGRTTVWVHDPALGLTSLPGGFAWSEPTP